MVGWCTFKSDSKKKTTRQKQKKLSMWQKTMFSFVNNIHNSFVNPELINNVQRNGVLYMQYFANDLSSTAEQYFLNLHISDICSNALQSNNFLSWKLQKISVQQRYLYGCRPLYHFNNWNFPLHNSVKKKQKKKTKKLSRFISSCWATR